MASENKYLFWTQKLNSPAPNCVYMETDHAVCDACLPKLCTIINVLESYETFYNQQTINGYFLAREKVFTGPNLVDPFYAAVYTKVPPLWSSGQSFWLQIQRSRVRSPALPDFLSSSGSGTGSTQPREVKLSSYLNKKVGAPGSENGD